MKVRGQVVTAAAATVILFAAASGILLSSGSRTSFAEPLNAEGLQALQIAVTAPSSALAAVLAQMDAIQLGSSAQFVAAMKTNTDTDALATALQNLVAANGALQVTITSALSTLASAPSLAAVTTTAGNYVNLPNLLSSDANRPILTATRPVQTNLASTYSQPVGQAGGVQGLENLNPAAPAPLFTASNSLTNPFTRPGQNPALALPGNGAAPPVAQTIPPANGGRPNSRP
jgi:hypothetical protein